jgi:hypothetical protein
MKAGAPVLLSPRVRQSPSKTSDREVSRRSALNDRRDDAGRHEGEGSQQADMPLALAFLLCDLCEGCNSTLSDVVNPSPGLGDSGQLGLPALRLQCGPSCRRRMNDSLDGGETRSRPGQRDYGR